MLNSLSFLLRYAMVLLAPDGVDGGGGGGPPPSSPSGEGSPSGAPSGSPSASASSEPSPGGSPSTPQTSTPPGGGSDTYSFMDSIFGEADGSPTPVAAPKTEAPAAPVVQPQPAPAPAPQVATPAAEGAPPLQAPAQAQPGQAAPQASQESFDPADPVSLARGLVANYDAAVEHLATRVFALSPQDMEALETDVAGTVPKLLAKAVVFMQSQVLTQMGRIIPQMLTRHAEVTKTHTANMDAFYAAWPSIDRKHDKAVAEIASRFRRMNPDMPTAQMIEAVGPFVLMALGQPLVPPTKPGTAAATQLQPVANGKAAHFQPAAPGAVTVQQTAVQDPFGFLGAAE